MKAVTFHQPQYVSPIGLIITKLCDPAGKLEAPAVFTNGLNHDQKIDQGIYDTYTILELCSTIGKSYCMLFCH